MKEALTLTSSLLLGMALLMLGAGLQGTLIGVRATLEGFPTLVIGAVMACYYAGYLAGSVAAPRLVHRVGHIRVFAAFSSLASAAILLQAMFVHELSWALLRGLTGLSFAGIYVVAESWLNDRANNRTRASLLAVYMAVIYVGLGVGQFLLKAGDPSETVLFILVAVLISLSVVPMSLSAQRAPELVLPQHVRLRELVELSPLAVTGVVYSGVAAGTVFALGPVYAADRFDTSGIANFMAFIIFTAVLAQWPLGRLSDRLERRTVLSGICIAAALAGAAALWLADATRAPFFVAAALCGGLSLTIYSLALSHMNDHFEPAQMVGVSGTMILLNGVGAIVGPLAVAGAMQAWGPRAFFGALAAMHAAFAAYTLWRKRRRAPVAGHAKTPYVAAQPQAPTGQLTAGAERAAQQTE